MGRYFITGGLSKKQTKKKRPVAIASGLCLRMLSHAVQRCVTGQAVCQWVTAKWYHIGRPVGPCFQQWENLNRNAMERTEPVLACCAGHMPAWDQVPATMNAKVTQMPWTHGYEAASAAKGLHILLMRLQNSKTIEFLRPVLSDLSDSSQGLGLPREHVFRCWCCVTGMFSQMRQHMR